MDRINTKNLDNAVRSLHVQFPGPGGAVGVVKNGKTILKHTWGYADPQNHVPMSLDTLFPICSITKQFTCGLLIDLVGDPSQLDGRVAHALPALEGEQPTVVQLCNNQSGLRDYWALTVLYGAKADGRFTDADATEIFERTRTTHFRPGTQYSYSNGNFRILSRLLEQHTARNFATLLRNRIFERVGMTTAIMANDTSQPLNGIVGHEGNSVLGFFPAVNRIDWRGDAAIAASLEDMLAWEIFIDQTRDEPAGLYNKLSSPQRFVDGTLARYGYGIAHETIDGSGVTGHGGGLRGFRCRRFHMAAQRLSVVVMFNHEADAHSAATSVLRAALGAVQPEPAPSKSNWEGRFIEPESGLALDVRAGEHHLTARFGVYAEMMAAASEGEVRSKDMTLALKGGDIQINRVWENFSARAKRISGRVRLDIEGQYYSEELNSCLTIVSAGGAFHGSFNGFLGESEMYPIFSIGGDIWLLACARSMDAPSPGSWTMIFKRDIRGKISGLTIGCWLARSIGYVKRQ